jgi:hypothetical protein
MLMLEAHELEEYADVRRDRAFGIWRDSQTEGTIQVGG